MPGRKRKSLTPEGVSYSEGKRQTTLKPRLYKGNREAGVSQGRGATARRRATAS